MPVSTVTSTFCLPSSLQEVPRFYSLLGSLLEVNALLHPIRAASRDLCSLCLALDFDLVGGANPFHPDTTDFALHSFRETANSQAPSGFRLLAVAPDGNCQFLAFQAALRPAHGPWVRDARGSGRLVSNTCVSLLTSALLSLMACSLMEHGEIRTFYKPPQLFTK